MNWERGRLVRIGFKRRAPGNCYHKILSGNAGEGTRAPSIGGWMLPHAVPALMLSRIYLNALSVSDMPSPYQS